MASLNSNVIYYHVYFNSYTQKYMIQDSSNQICDTKQNLIATFHNFHMAYDYVTKLNGNCMANIYSKWTVNR